MDEKSSSRGGEGEESTVGRAGETRRLPTVADRFRALDIGLMLLYLYCCRCCLLFDGSLWHGSMFDHGSMMEMKI